MKLNLASAKKGIRKFLAGDFFGLAAEISFYLLSSFFPMIIMIFTIASFISLNYTDALFVAISSLPHQAADLLTDMLMSPGRSTAVIAITGFLSLFTLSGLILTIEKGINRFYKTEKKRSNLTSRVMAIVLAFFIYISIIASFGLVVFGRVIGTYIYTFTSDEGLMKLWYYSRYVLILVFIVMVISAIYKALPTVKVKIREVLPGAVFTTVAWYFSSMLFALYVNNFPQYEIIYGSLAGFVCMIMWIYLTGIVLIAGAKINALIYRHKIHVCQRKELN